MSHKPRSAERAVKVGTVDWREQKVLEHQPHKRPLKTHQLSKLDKGLKNY